MFDDMRPYMFRTNDSGKTWKKITAGLPSYAFIWVIREDLKNPNVLYAGTETGLFASFDAGDHWAPFGLKNLPDVAVRDIFLQPDENDILLATHGRGLCILDDATPVQQMAAAANRSAALFPIRPAVRHALRATRSGGGETEFAAPNPPYGALLNYYLRESVNDLKIEILDAAGKVVRTIAGPGAAGFHRVAWDLRAAGFAGGARGRGPQVLPGTYTVKLTGQGINERQDLEVRLDPEMKVEMAALESQWNVLAKLGAMSREVGEMVRQADRHADSPDWQKFRATLTRPRNLTASETGPRLSEQLQSLFNLIDGPNGAPTPAMMKLLEELQAEFDRSAATFKSMNP